jgi:uncharacterized tellurite resistance protein B-like protein
MLAGMTPEQGEVFLGGLLAVARADGVVLPEEMRELRAIAAEHGLTMPLEEELLFQPEVEARHIVDAKVPGPEFLAAALRMALADRELVEEEVAVLRALAKAIGCPTEGIAGWGAVRTYDGQA